jgi:hypothetical protein
MRDKMAQVRFWFLINLIFLIGSIPLRAQKTTQSDAQQEKIEKKVSANTQTNKAADKKAEEKKAEVKVNEKVKAEETKKAAQEGAVKVVPEKDETSAEKKEKVKSKEEETKLEEKAVKEIKPEKKAAEAKPEEEVAEEKIEKEEEVTEEAKPEEMVEEVKPEEEKVVEPEPEIEGFDTVDLETPAGNWLLKRIWWEKAQAKFNKIRMNVNKIADSIMPFFSQQNTFEKTVLDPFYRDIGFEQGELQEAISSLIIKMQQQREREGTLDLEERDFLRLLLSEQKSINQLGKDVKAINEMDNKLDEAITTLLKQVNQARMYENQAWQKFDAIAHELNDLKAQELFYSMDALSKSVEDINTYIQKDFSNYFNQILTRAKDQVDNIKEIIKSLQEKGIDLKKQITQMTEEEVGKEVSEIPKKAAEVGWGSRFWNYLKSWFS